MGTEIKHDAENGAAVGCSALLGVGACGLHRRTPYGMTNVSMTQLSIARHYGGCKYQGESYTYLPHTDELIRDDVLKWKRKHERKRKTPKRPKLSDRRPKAMKTTEGNNGGSLKREVRRRLTGAKWANSCDMCRNQEGHHYCLLHSITLKNMDTIKCDDHAPK